MKVKWKCSYCGTEDPCIFIMPEDIDTAAPPSKCPWRDDAGWVRVESEADDVEE